MDEYLLLEGIKGAPFKFEEVKNVKLWCSSEIAGYVIEKASSEKGELITKQDDGSVILRYSLAAKQDLIRLVLAEGGNMKVLEPKELIAEVKTKAEKVVILHK